MTNLNERAVGESPAPEQPAMIHREPLYTRYCAAPQPTHPIGEPRLVHTLMLAAWLGHLIDPLPHKGHRGMHGV